VNASKYDCILYGDFKTSSVSVRISPDVLSTGIESCNKVIRLAKKLIDFLELLIYFILSNQATFMAIFCKLYKGQGQRDLATIENWELKY
jgi:hypothetical protein